MRQMMRETTIRLSVSVSDDSFDSGVTFPVSASKEQIQNVVQAWLTMLDAAVKATSKTDGEQGTELIGREA